MPKSNLCVSNEILRYTDELRNRYGGMMTFAEVGKELGIRRYDSVKSYLTGIDLYEVNGRAKVKVLDFAIFVHGKKLVDKC